MDKLPEHVQANRDYWDGAADQWVADGERNWAQRHPTWGVWGIPEQQVNMLPESMRGMHCIELGCGTGYVSAWMMKRGARCVGIDNSAQQLATARRLMEQHELPMELLHGNAEQVPYPDASFDFAISEYGAAIWCDPFLWIPEAHRLLRPGGELVFLGSHPLAAITTPPNGDVSEDRLHTNYFDLHRMDWRDVEIDPGGIEFNLPFAGWLNLFRRTGFEVVDYLELRAPANSPEVRFSVRADWARQWPGEQVWKLRKTT